MYSSRLHSRLIILCISIVSIVIYPLLFLILFIWAFSLFFRWVYLKICHVYPFKEPTFSCIDLFHCLLSLYFIVSALTLEKAMAPHSSTPAWKIPWTEEPGRLQSMGSLGVGHDWATSLSLFTFMHWRRKWQPTPVFLAGESQGRGSLVGCRLWGCTESDTTEAT